MRSTEKRFGRIILSLTLVLALLAGGGTAARRRWRRRRPSP